MLHLRQHRDSMLATTRWCNTFEENLKQWPHLNELVHSYTTDWVKDENKYGHYEIVGSPSFHNQIYEGPDIDIETKMRLVGARRTKGDDISKGDIPSTSRRCTTCFNLFVNPVEEVSCIEELISILDKLSRGTQFPLEYISYTGHYHKKKLIVVPWKDPKRGDPKTPKDELKILREAVQKLPQDELNTLREAV
ncbi:Guanine nucleotide exchange factor SPIKE 1, partial [Mucuna pruriens]